MNEPLIELGAPIKATADKTLYTRQSAWRATVIPTETPSLKVFRGMSDQFLPMDQPGQVMVPWDAFMHTQLTAWVGLEAEFPDGEALPAWITLDRRSGFFTVRPPVGYQGELNISLRARDTTGLEAVTMFKLRVGEKLADKQAQDLLEKPGRSSLAEQLRSAARQRHTGMPAERAMAPVSLAEPATQAMARSK